MIGGIIRFIFSGEAKPLEDAAGKAKGSLSDLKKELRDNVSEVAKWTAAMAAAGVALSVHMINEAREAVDQQAKLAVSMRETFNSIQILSRGAQAAGVEFDQLVQAGKNLDQVLSRAISGEAAAGALLKQLGLEAAELVKVPLPERIATINNAIKEHVPLVQRAGVSAELWGTKLAHAIMLFNNDAIQTATHDIELFGLALDEVDVAKVEAANDSLSKISAGMTGFWRQMSVQAAPVMQALGVEFEQLVEEMGGMDIVAEKAFEKVIKGAAFSADAVEGFRRTVEVMGQGVAVVTMSILQGWIKITEQIISGPTKAVNMMINFLNAVDPFYSFKNIEIPDMAKRMQAEVNLMSGAIKEGAADIQRTLMQPLPSAGLLKFWEDAKKTATETAAISAAAKSAMMAPMGGGISWVDPTIMQNLKKQIEAQLESVRASHRTELEALRVKLEEEKEILQQAFDNRLITQQQFYVELLQLTADYEQDKTKIEKRQADERQRAEEKAHREKYAKYQGVMGDISTLMNTESRKMFEVGKAAAIANAIIDTHAGMTKALAQGGFWGIAMAAAVAAKGFASVSAIRAQQFGSSGGGGGGAASATQAVNAATTPVGGASGTSAGGANTVVHLHGEVFSQGMVRGLIEQLNEAHRDGGRITLA